MEMHIMSGASLLCIFYMAVESHLHAHAIGFPYQADLKKSDGNGDSRENVKQDDIKTADPILYIKALYQISNKYLQNGYSVLYTAESLRDDRDKAREIGRY